MTIEELRSARDATPFRPFSIHLSDRRTYRIPQRDYLAVAPSGRTIIVYETNEAFRIIDFYLVNGLEYEAVTASSAAA